MTRFRTLTSPVKPFFRDNVSTDVIYAGPRADLQTGIVAHNIFRHFRFDETGRERPESLFDKKPFDKAAILVAGRGFGGGKTPDVAAQALRAFGVQCVTAVSFSKKFETAARRAGILPVTVNYREAATLAEEAGEGDAITIDAEAGQIITSHGERIGISVEPGEDPEDSERSGKAGGDAAAPDHLFVSAAP
ncbi:MAG: hypothetical protein AAGB02_00520 [Pseudomonadota bacterium]